MKSPCYKCTDRVLGCHSTCEKYAEFKEQNDAYKKKSYEHRGLDIVLENGQYRRAKTRLRQNKSLRKY